MIGLKIEYKHKNGLSRNYNFYFPQFFQRDTSFVFGVSGQYLRV